MRSIALCLAALLVLPLTLAHAVAPGNAVEGGVGAGTPAVVAPAAASADYSDPKKTLQTLAAAVKAKDAAAIRHCLWIDESDKPAAEALLSTMDSSLRFQKAVADKFGPAAAKEVEGMSNQDLLMTSRLKALDDAKLVQEGDTAVLTLEENSPLISSAPTDIAEGTTRKEVAFRKVDGQWKIDAGKVMNLKNARVTAILPTMAKIGKVLNSTAEEIENGKIATLQQARQMLTQRTFAVLQEARQPAATQAATSEAATQP